MELMGIVESFVITSASNRRLVRTIVEAHGGSVSVTHPQGGGSAFAMFLTDAPVSTARPRPL